MSATAEKKAYPGQPEGCIYPACRCEHRCGDLFGPVSVPPLKAGTCDQCGRRSTVYRVTIGFWCKSCIAAGAR